MDELCLGELEWYITYREYVALHSNLFHEDQDTITDRLRFGLDHAWQDEMDFDETCLLWVGCLSFNVSTLGLATPPGNHLGEENLKWARISPDQVCQLKAPCQRENRTTDQITDEARKNRFGGYGMSSLPTGYKQGSQDQWLFSVLCLISHRFTVSLQFITTPANADVAKFLILNGNTCVSWTTVVHDALTAERGPTAMSGHHRAFDGKDQTNSPGGSTPQSKPDDPRPDGRIKQNSLGS
ncbi:hypothetical protein BO78DRAFT_447896 [Aspergillus sclerotiicarbonarius CBS 121057]|uniref:Uncharacterized protein n=1 Tax=Aspergillus sclerotiicarbonarius (strain CBS 121057 / IBT 28362) TaxID=1448318 RepID=A0A319EB27_ASPSB|nr:hypothetical protein BO78DRAFT_447896 [Aspergillus sclerotiicarbonarius CBS 121057]